MNKKPTPEISPFLPADLTKAEASASIDRRSFIMRNTVIRATAVMTVPVESFAHRCATPSHQFFDPF